LVLALGEPEYDRRKRIEAVEWIRSQPGRFRQLTIQRILEFWFPVPVGLRYPTYGIWLVTILSLPGLFLMAKRKEPATLLIAAIWFIFPLMYYVMYSSDRYRYPILWTSLLPAGYLLGRIFPSRDRAHRRSAT
jgi:hypothetical protein